MSAASADDHDHDHDHDHDEDQDRDHDHTQPHDTLAAISASTSIPQCVASTGDEFKRPTYRFPSASASAEARARRFNFFRQAQVSPDGTTILTHTEDHCLRSFVLPENLLDNGNCEHWHLEAYSTFVSNTNVQAFASHPNFNLLDPSSTLLLSSNADNPLTLRNALNLNFTHAHYPFDRAKTEERRSARSLTFTRNGQHFLAGGENVLAVFDCSRDGYGPISEHQLRPGKRVAQTDAWNFTRRAFASAMSISSEGFLALGTTQSEIGLYECDGLGECISTFALDTASGSGVTDVKWSPDGRYLLVAQRQSDIIDVYDVRCTQQKVGCLTGRKSKRAQRMGIDVIATSKGYEVWAGGSDGRVRMWNNPGKDGVEQAPEQEFHLHDSPVSSIAWHHSGAVVATSSGERFPPSTRKDRESESHSTDTDDSDDYNGEKSHEDVVLPDNSLKIWTI